MDILNIPLKPFYVGHTTFKLPNMDINDLINIIQDFLINMKKIKRLKKVDFYDFCYECEYYAIDGVEIDPNDKLFVKKYFAAIYCAQKAMELLPHNMPNYDDYIYDNLDSSPSLSCWFKMRIHINYDFSNNGYILQVIKLQGDTSTFYNVYNKLKHALNEKNCLWFIRKNYISLKEDNTPKTNDRITDYLFNDLICKEICSYY